MRTVVKAAISIGAPKVFQNDYSVSRRGGRNKEGGVSKCEQTQTNADKRGQTQRRKRRGKKIRKQTRAKRGQTQTNTYTPLDCGFFFFTPSFAIPLIIAKVFVGIVLFCCCESRIFTRNSLNKSFLDGGNSALVKARHSGIVRFAVRDSVPLRSGIKIRVLAKGGFAESSGKSKKTKSTQGHFPGSACWHSEHSQRRFAKNLLFVIDLLMGLFRGAVFDHGEVQENCPLALMGRFPSLMGRFPSFMGRFPKNALMGLFPS